MTDVATWRVAELSSIGPTDGWYPIRKALGIDAFGVNAWSPDADGHLMGEHDELTTGHEELYVVLAGNATFTLDGEAVEAGTGTLVFLADPSTPRAAKGAPGTVVLTIGAPKGRAFKVSDWEAALPGFRRYRVGDYEGALAEWQQAIQEHPELRQLHYNAACAAALLDRPDSAIEYLRRALELDPEETYKPEEEEAFAGLRSNAEFQKLVRRVD